MVERVPSSLLDVRDCCVQIHSGGCQQLRCITSSAVSPHLWDLSASHSKHLHLQCIVHHWILKQNDASPLLSPHHGNRWLVIWIQWRLSVEHTRAWLESMKDVLDQKAINATQRFWLNILCIFLCFLIKAAGKEVKEDVSDPNQRGECSSGEQNQDLLDDIILCAQCLGRDSRLAISSLNGSTQNVEKHHQLDDSNEGTKKVNLGSDLDFVLCLIRVCKNVEIGWSVEKGVHIMPEMRIIVLFIKPGKLLKVVHSKCKQVGQSDDTASNDEASIVVGRACSGVRLQVDTQSRYQGTGSSEGCQRNHNLDDIVDKTKRTTE
ncbi:hypothetical protein EDD86DRAFT_109093 [Gorgonomyces haynaldii]|nr:hypothetical protein EDD86DRAFT_109093 [Gorgonomyces haynaldii]